MTILLHFVTLTFRCKVEQCKPISRTELEPLADGLAKTFIQRWDLFPRQLDAGSYVCIRKPLEQRHILAHLRGDLTLGVYLLDNNSQAKFIVFDADNPEQMDRLFRTARNLGDEDIPAYLERSRRGGHLWLFFQEPVPGKDARSFGHSLVSAHGLDDIELYPKQDHLKGGPGSLMRLPFGIHRFNRKRYGFITPFGQPIAPRLRDQIPNLFTPKSVPREAFQTYKAVAFPADEMPEKGWLETDANSLSQTIKNATSVFEFVSRYIDLSSAGQGLCPFHDDQHASFSVNIEENYWHCFAGCGGGSVIDYWMIKEGCDFVAAVTELAELLT